MYEWIPWLLLGILACVGFVDCCTWLHLRIWRKPVKLYRLIPVGGEGKDTEQQLAAAYASLQWEQNPMRYQYVLFDAGLPEKQAKECIQLARGAGVEFVRDIEELESLLGQ